MKKKRIIIWLLLFFVSGIIVTILISNIILRPKGFMPPDTFICQNNLKKIYTALIQYNACFAKFPQDIERLFESGFLKERDILICPYEKEAKSCSYKYIQGLEEGMPPELIILCCANDHNYGGVKSSHILRLDKEFDWKSKHGLTQMLYRQKEALKVIRLDADFYKLEDILQDPNSNVLEKKLAIWKIAKLKIPKGIQLLEKSLTLSDSSIRFYAAVGLSKFGERDGLGILIDFLNHNKFYYREIAIKVLEKLTGKTRGYFPQGSKKLRNAAIRRWKEWESNFK